MGDPRGAPVTRKERARLRRLELENADLRRRLDRALVALSTALDLIRETLAGTAGAPTTDTQDAP